MIKNRSEDLLQSHIKTHVAMIQCYVVWHIL